MKTVTKDNDGSNANRAHQEKVLATTEQEEPTNEVVVNIEKIQ